MNIQEINELTVQQTESILIERLNLDEGLEPTPEQLESELELYKAELIADENDRLERLAEEARLAEIARVEDLKARFAALTDSGLIQAQGIQNPAAYFRDEILKNSDKAQAEQKLATIESNYLAFEQANVASEKGQVRKKIEGILNATDWLFISDNPVPTSYRTHYKNYRQYLRDADLSAEKLEMFDHYLRRLHPELFMDGGEGAKIIAKFNAYL